MYFEIKNGIRESNEKKCGMLDFRETESGNICAIRTPSQTLKYLTLKTLSNSPSSIGVSLKRCLRLGTLQFKTLHAQNTKEITS